MTKTVEFIFDVVSPTAYLAYKRLPEIAERTGATIQWTPVFLGGVMKGSGNTRPGAVPAKGKYMDRDLQRCAARYHIPFTLNHHFPVNTLLLQRAAVAVFDEYGKETFLRLIDACFQAMWVDGKDLGGPAVAAEVFTEAEFDPDELVAQASDPAIKERLKENTDGAVARGVFGAPTFFVGEEMYFGQDRLDYVEAALNLTPS